MARIDGWRWVRLPAAAIVVWAWCAAGCHQPMAAEPLGAEMPAPISATVAEPLAPAPIPAAAGTPTFSPEAYLAHVYYLASDELEGRGVGTEGIRRATDYIADYFRHCGLQPGGDDGTYFQTFGMKTGAELTDEGEFVVDGADVVPKLHEDYVPFPFSSDDAFDGDVVFCGYGIVNADKQHDDYMHNDVTGKVVLVLRQEPPDWEPEEGHFTEFATFQTKVYNARNRDAAAVLIVNRVSEEEADELMPFRVGPNTSEYGLPAFHVSQALAEKLLVAGGLGSLAELQQKADQGEFVSAALTGVRVKGRAGIRWNRSDVRNVVGILPGSGPLADEYVVIGAHHDHLGVQAPGRGPSLGKGTGPPEIHNGADDNASGTAGVIELARAFAATGPLNRSLVFMTFTAEESGLLGSLHYVSHPTIPLDRIEAMLNLDMIGRMPEDKNRVQVFGTKSAEEFEDLVQQYSQQVGIDVQTAGGAIGGSDQTSFFTKGVPALHFFTGVHRDYHSPSDDADRINEQGAAQVLKLVYDLAYDLANRDTRLTYNAVAAGPQRSPTGFKVVMGIMPSYVEEEIPGMEVVAVSEGRPAQAAGMQDGDRILKIDGKTVNNVYDYMAALTGKNPGDAVEVVVQRGEEQLTLQVVLAAGQ
jgi:hypothetical protein